MAIPQTGRGSIGGIVTDATGRQRARRRWLRPALLGAALVAGAIVLGSSALTGSHPDSSPIAATAAQLNVNASSFSYNPGSPGTSVSSIQYVKGQPKALTLTVYAMPASGTATIFADLTNQTASAITFSAGAAVEVAVTKDGQPWDQVLLVEPGITRLGPGQKVTLQTSIGLGSGGVYGLTAVLASPSQP